jgi:hypothetical protein
MWNSLLLVLLCSAPVLAADRAQTVLIESRWPPAVIAATAWLHANGYQVVERRDVNRLLDEQHFRLQHSSEWDADRLAVGNMPRADLILFLDVQNFDREASVTLKAVSVETGAIVTSGRLSRRWAGGPLTEDFSRLTEDLTRLLLIPLRHAGQ